MRWRDQEWFTVTGVLLKIGLVAAGIFLAGAYLERAWRKPFEREKPQQIDFHADLYVNPPKSYVRNFETAQRKLVGMTLWVREGWRWAYEPGERFFEPLEKVVPTRVFQRRDAILIGFKRDGASASFVIGRGDRAFVDDIFFINDPRELYSHWSDEAWEKIENHQVELGMSERQVGFALGAGVPVLARNGSPIRIVAYTFCEEGGLEPVRVTFRDWVAEKIEPIGY